VSEEAIKIFYSYSRKDLDMRNTLEKHLATLRKAGKISTWHDLQLEAGTEWEPEILGKLDTADIILLLISSDFIDSEYCYGTELKRAIERHREGTARVIPIILRSCDWNHSDVPFSKLNVLPTHAEAIASSLNQDDAFTKVAQKIRETVEQLTAKKQQDKLNQQRPKQFNAKPFQGFQEELIAPIREASKPAQVAQPPNRKPPLDTFRFEVATITGVQKTGGLFGMGRYGSCAIKRDRRTAQFYPEDLGNGVTLEMVQIPGGTFVMGSPKTEAQSLDSERPQHSVTVSPFLMGKFPVTEAQYVAVMGNNPATESYDGRFVASNRPVVDVSWKKAIAFCERLSEQTGKPYRLPSEAEWEYACRAGTKTPFHFGDTIRTHLANYNGMYFYGLASHGTYIEESTPVGSFSANAFGLFDMHGNVWEWCLDHWHDNYEGAPVDGSAWLDNNDSLNVEARRLLRGGSYFNDPRYCRSACRNDYRADYQNYGVGFRVVCDVSWT